MFEDTNLKNVDTQEILDEIYQVIADLYQFCLPLL